MKKRCISLALVFLLSTASMLAQSYSNKLSPYLRQVVTGDFPANRRAAASNQPVSVLAKLAEQADEQALAAKYGFEVANRIGRVLIIRIPLANIPAMAEDAAVVRIEAERAPRPMMDVVPGQIQADKVHQGASNQLSADYTGEGVIVGIVDAGFDYIHPFFRDNSGTTRVKWAADYMKDKKYTTATAITTAMHSSDASTLCHGTHVAGIAAGSKVQDSDWDPQTSKSYKGVAPDADIVMGAVNSEIKTDGTGLQFDNSLQAFADIFTYADEQGMPCVINYSMGDAMSFSNNRQLANEAIHGLLFNASGDPIPGRAIVVSSGNSGSSFRLAHKTSDLAEGGTGVMFHNEDSYGQYLGVELKVLPTQTIRFRKTNSLYSATTAEYSATASELATKATITCGKTLHVANRGTTTDGYQVIYVTSGNATFTTSERILVTIQGEGEAWIYGDPLCAPLEPANTVANHSLLLDGYSMTWPAMLPEVITVGNIAQRLKIVTMANKYASQSGVVTPTDLTPYESTKGEGYLAKSSSVGPTLTGIMKPDVCAPGVNVVSAMNFFIDDDTYYAFAAWDICSLDTEYETWGGLSGYFHMFAQTGSSMSAPVVTGTIALWMQEDPTLTTERIKDVIAHSSRQPDSELTYPNNEYGYGEVNAYAGMQYLLQTLGIEEVRSEMTDGRSAAIYDLQGRKIAHGTLSERTLSKGLYIVNGRKVAYR